MRTIEFCVLSVSGPDNDKDNPNDIIFSIKNIKLHASLATLLAKNN